MHKPTFEEVEQLVYRLKSISYYHGMIDETPYLSDKKYDEAAAKSNNVLTDLLDKIRLLYD